MLLLKPTYDECCPIKLTLKLVEESKGPGPIFITPMRVPLQSWLLKWVRCRMTEIGKKPELYGLRSIRQGATSRAQDTQMPEIFLRASGGWKGRAMDAYSKDCLPGEQQRFAKGLGQIQAPTPLRKKRRGSISKIIDPAVTCSAQSGRAGVNPGELTPRRTPGISLRRF